MKIILSIVLFLAAFAVKAAKIVLTGKVLVPTRDSIELILPFSEHFHAENSVWARLKADSTFSFEVNVPGSRMAVMRYDGREMPVFLMPGFPVLVTLVNRKGLLFSTFDGPGAPANNFLNNELVFPITNFKDSAQWTYASVQQIVFTGIYSHLQECRNVMLDSLTIGVENIGLIISELKYTYCQYFEKYCRDLFLKHRKDGLGKEIWDQAAFLFLVWPGIPSPKELNAGMAAKIWMVEYGKLKYERYVEAYYKNPDTWKAAKIFGDSVMMPPNQDTAWRAQYGDPYVYAIQRGN